MTNNIDAESVTRGIDAESVTRGIDAESVTRGIGAESVTSGIDADFGALAAKLRASTVRVVDERGRGQGSGIVWNAHGLILTNAHVVRGGSALVVGDNGAKFRARVVGRDPQRDLAALHVDVRTDLVPAEIRASAPAVGELVVAAGNPLGLVGAVTAGVVHRSSSRWVVADVRLAPGNSGGPLADAEGRVVGINSMVARGLALAIPVATVAAFLGIAVGPEGTRAA
jgi:serine protease Do